jgi:hypothetical protein
MMPKIASSANAMSDGEIEKWKSWSVAALQRCSGGALPRRRYGGWWGLIWGKSIIINTVAMRLEDRSGAFGFWLCFRSVTGPEGHAPSLSLAKTPKSLAAA